MKKSSIQGQRGSASQDTNPKNMCMCTRPSSNVLCNVCGYIGVGRVRRVCPQHQRTLYLMDLNQCPRCRAYSSMMQEFSTDEVK